MAKRRDADADARMDVGPSSFLAMELISREREGQLRSSGEVYDQRPLGLVAAVKERRER